VKTLNNAQTTGPFGREVMTSLKQPVFELLQEYRT
jgi:hypothetical protein